MSSTPRLDASRRNVTKSLTTLVVSANVITHSREMLVLRGRLQLAPERHRRNHTMRRLILLAAGFGSVAALIPAAPEFAAETKPATAFAMPEEPEDVNPQNPEEALPSFDDF